MVRHLSKTIIEEYCGVENNDEGAVFKITLPLKVITR